MHERPKQEEWEMVRVYCLERPLDRPKTNIKTAILVVTLFLVTVSGISFAAIHFFSYLGLHSYSIASVVLISFACFVLCFLLLLKRAIIGTVKLYQHYAPETMRRKCILKPSCSEYMILALKKYGLIRGMRKSIHRLLVTCRGWDYRIDEP